MNGRSHVPPPRCATLVVVLGLAGCATTARLDAHFDSDAANTAPQTYPQPSPPDDVLASYSSTGTTATVVPAPDGGQWLRITPQPSFVADPDWRRRALIVTSDSFSAGATIRGHLRVRVDQLGSLYFGLRAEQGSQSTDFLGGFAVSNFIGGSRQAELLNPFTLNGMEDLYPLFSSAGVIANVPPGQAIDIHWSLDQGSRTIAASALGGPSKSVGFPATSNGVATTPVQRLSLWIWLGKPSSGTAAFVDNLFIEEYK